MIDDKNNLIILYIYLLLRINKNYYNIIIKRNK